MSGQIFISYRRDDSSGWAGRLYDQISASFPESKVFMDVDSLDPGVDFVEAIETSVGRCEVLIAVIGKHWLDSSDEQGKHRLENPDDIVRLEIATALKRNIRVIPVLVDGALMPRSGEIPDDLKPLARRNALEVSRDRFPFDSGRLTDTIKRFFEKTEAEQREREEKERLENRNQSERVLEPLDPNPASKFQQSAKAGPKEEAASAIVPPSLAPSQDRGPAQAETPPTIQSQGSTKQKPSVYVAALVVFVVILAVGLIWFAGLKLRNSGSEAALVTATPASTTVPTASPIPTAATTTPATTASTNLAITALPSNPTPRLRTTKPAIPVIVKDTTSFFWQIVLAGARKAGRDLDVNVVQLGAQSESDINGQISILENAVSEKPAAIVIAPTQFKALGQPIDEAAKKAIIIGIDSAADSKAFTSFLATDNVQGGRAGADALAAAVAAKYGKPQGDVALITSIPGVGSLNQRAKGFKEEIAAKYPGLKLVADKVADGMAATALNIMTDLITANPNLRGVFASNLIMAQGAGQAIAENKVADKIKLVGFDSDDRLVKLLRNGNIAALIVQDPYRMGYEGVKTALAASNGEKVPATVDTGVNVITKENMDSARSLELLNPKVK